MNTALAPVMIRTKGPDGMRPVIGDILLASNEIVFDGGPPVELECAQDVAFRNNRFLRSDGSPGAHREAVRVDAASRNIQW